MNIRVNPIILFCVLILLLLGTFTGRTLGQETQESFNRFHWEEMPSIPPGMGMKVQPGLAFPFAGASNGVVLVAGGCNFPGRPVFEGGSKKYYNDIFVLEEQKNGQFAWNNKFKLPHAVAYGASLTLPQGMLCIGGNNDVETLRDVFLLKWNPVLKTPEFEQWPTLPFTMSQMAVAKVGNTIYLAGGFTDGKPSNKFLALDLSKKGTKDFLWEVLPDYPGPARLQAVAVAQNDAEEAHFYLFGGSSFPEETIEPIITTDGLEYNPKKRTWSPIADIAPKGKVPYSLHGAGGVPIGAHHVLFVGGVNHQIFREAWKRERQIEITRKVNNQATLDKLEQEKLEYFKHMPEWYQFNQDVLIYHTLTNSWTVGDEYPFPAPTGAPVVKWRDGWLVINGELKPGVRSPKVYFGKCENRPDFGWANWTVLILYLLGMLYLGYFFMKRENSTEDFFKGGERIPWWAAGMSIFATMLSAITFMAIPAKTFGTDWKYFPMAITILIMAFPVVKYYLPFFRRLKVTTAYEYLEQRFSYATRFLASVLFIIFMVARMALVLFLPSLALTTVTGIDIYTCIVLMGIITIIYCTMGGVEAVVWGDVIQGFVLLGGALLAVVFLVNGTEGGWNQVMEISIANHKLETFDLAFDFSSATLWVVLLGGLANNLISYSSDQTVIQRYLTTKDETAAGKSILLNGVLSIVVSLVFYFIGTALYAYYKTQPELLNFTMGNPDSIFPHFIMTKMPIGIAGLLIAAIFAATMSTVSSNINSLSTAFTADIYQHFFVGRSDKQKLRVARFSGVILGGVGILLALLMATWNILSLFDYFNYILGLLASGLGGLFMMGIFFPRVGPKAAIIGFFGGTGILFLMSYYTDVHFLLFGFIGMMGTVLVGWLASYLIPEKQKSLDGLTVLALKDVKVAVEKIKI